MWDYFSEGGSVFIVMEYAAGGDLADMVKIRKTQQHYMTEREVLLLVVQMVSALAHLHSRKIIHRDFKSPNVFLTSNGMVKLGDFGIARSLDNSLDHAETQVGTPFYYSPEVCKGEPYNHKSDVWSLGNKQPGHPSRSVHSALRHPCIIHSNNPSLSCKICYILFLLCMFFTLAFTLA